jgi:hypothetical protein
METLIKEKGLEPEDNINIEGHIGLTWQMLVDSISNMPKSSQQQIRQTLVMIEFKNGDVFFYLRHLAYVFLV